MYMKTLSIGSHSLSYSEYQHIAEGSTQLTLSEDATSMIRASRAFLENKTARSERPIYGVNTGFGSLCNIEIGEEDLDWFKQIWSALTLVGWGIMCALR